jgi:hypothetical protein
VRRLVVVAIASAALGACGGGGAAKQAEQLGSASAEGALLAQHAADGEALGPFTKVHARDLHELAAPLEESGSTAEVRRLARAVSAALERLREDPGDREQASRVAALLRAAAARAERLEERA